jgi:hypothetical protein
MSINVYPIEQHLRSERSDTNTSTDKQDRLIVQEILRRRAERTVDHDTGKDLIKRRRNDPTASILLTLAIKVATDSLGKLAREITNNTNVDRDIVFLGGASEREGVPLEVGDFRAADEDVLTCTCGGLFLLDLDFDDLGWMLNDLGDVRPVARADFTKDTLVGKDETADEPVALEGGKSAQFRFK